MVVDGSDKPLMNRKNVSEILKINTSSLTLTEYIHGQDKGPYDAMNKGLRMVNIKRIGYGSLILVTVH